MMKSTFFLWMSYILGIHALAVPASDTDLVTREGPELPPELEGLRVVKYAGPHYELPEEEREKLRQARETSGYWERPKDMPVIHVEDGTVLDMGGGNSTLAKRAGWRWIASYGGYNCDPGTALTGVLNFGCGTGCIVLSTSAYSGLVQQESHGNPYPTMDVWDNNQCSGHYTQHFGVVDTRSCTNANNCCGYKSFIGWFDC